MLKATKPRAAKKAALPWKQYCSFAPPLLPPPCARMYAGLSAGTSTLPAALRRLGM